MPEIKGAGGLQEPRPVTFSQSGSLLLDIVRFSAALVVLAHHFTDSRYSTGWPSLGVWANEAVCVFFVLSGFVIRFVTVTRIGTAAAYAIDRVSRIYSIVVPALLFTVLAEGCALAIHPTVYRSLHEPAFAWSSVPLQLLANATFLAQCWGYGISPLSNPPFWSLSFECIYYLLYGIVFYRLPHRWFWVGLILLVAGPSIDLLALVWLLGAAACDLYLWLSRKAAGEWLAGILFASLLLLLAALRHSLLAFIRATDHDARLRWPTAAFARLPFSAHLVNAQGQIPWFAEASPSFAIVGLLTACGMVLGLLSLDRHAPSLPSRIARSTRLVADSTFALYLFHVPMMLLVVVLLGKPIHRALPASLLLGSIVAVTVPLAAQLDHLKDWMRRSLRRHFA